MHFWKGAKFAGCVGHPMTKMLLASPDQGLCPWTQLGAVPPDLRYRLVLHTRHGAPSAAYDPPGKNPVGAPATGLTPFL